MSNTQSHYEYAPTTDKRLNDELDTPWRYRCPECHSTTVICREPTKGKVYSEKRYTEYEPRAHRRASDTHIHEFRCHGCGAVFDEPYDTKVGSCRPIVER